MIVGLALLVSFVVGLLSGACLVAFALSRREASLTEWAAQLQRKAADPAHGGRHCVPLAAPAERRSPVEMPATVGPGHRYRWPVLCESVFIGDMTAFLRSTGQPWPVSDTWR